MKEQLYALMFDGTEHKGILAGTPVEIVRA